MSFWLTRDLSSESVALHYADPIQMNCKGEWYTSWLLRHLLPGEIIGELPKAGQKIEVTLTAKAVPKPTRARELWCLVKNGKVLTSHDIGNIWEAPVLFVRKLQAEQYRDHVSLDDVWVPTRYDTLPVEGDAP